MTVQRIVVEVGNLALLMPDLAEDVWTTCGMIKIEEPGVLI